MESAAAEHQYERTRIRRAKRLAADFLHHLEAAEKKAIEDGQVWQQSAVRDFEGLFLGVSRWTTAVLALLECLLVTATRYTTML